MLSADSKLRPKQIFTVAICLSIVFCSIAAVAGNKRSENNLNVLLGGNAKNEHLFAPMAAATILEQCANGGVGDPVEPCSGTNWVNGNVNQSKAHWVEGQSVVFRQALTGFTSGATGNAVTIGWDTTTVGKHAYDYLTSFDRTETLAMGNNPCSGISGCSLGTFTTAPIPTDPKVSAGHDQIPGNGDDITQIPGVFTLFGGTITNVSAYTVSGSYAGDSHTSITVTFTADSANMVLAWGGHIGKRLDWGPSNTALFKDGSPYHMSQNGCSFGCGFDGRALASLAVSTLDAPINDVPGTQSTDQNTPLTFSSGNGNAISVSDPDDADDGTSGNQNVQVELSVTNGAMTLSSVAGISFSFTDANGTGAGDGTADALMRFRGSINNVNAALNGMTFTPTAGFGGSASLQIITNDLGTSGDGEPLTDTDSVTINVDPPNQPPVADDDTYSVAEDGTLTVPAPTGVIMGDTDPDGDPLAVGSPVGPSNGSLTLNPDGSFIYTPNANFFGQDLFTYVVSDGLGGTDVGQVTITVNSVNDLPTVEVVRGGSCASSGKGGTLNLVVSDVESGAGSLSLGRSSSNTTLVPLANIAFGGSGGNRTISITAVQQQSTRSSVVTITVGDGDGGTSQVTVTVVVGSNNNVTINGTGGADMILAGNGNDTVNAGAGNDLVCGGTGNDTVNGGAGDDTIEGGNGNDILRGEAGNDTLRGGEGNDRLEGGSDNDALTGGLGGDRFMGGTGTDTATDVNPGQGDTTDGTVP